jgi:hypothetical protein
MKQCVRHLSARRGPLVVLLLLASSPVLAANRQAQERQARKACLTGDYASGVAILSDLFLDTKNPIHLFNQGRCFEVNRRFEEAIGRFEEYLRLVPSSPSSSSDKAEAEKHIASCRESLAKERATMPPPVATTPSASPFPAPANPVVVEPQPLSSPVQDRRGLRIAGIVTASVGVAAVVSGVLLNVKANSMVSDMQAGVGSYTAGKESDQKSYRTLSWVGYGIGGACLVAGAVMYGIGWRSGSRASSGGIAILPAVAPGQTGALLTGVF